MSLKQPLFFFFKVLTFGKNVTRLEVRIKILHDDEREMREAFTVHLTKDRNRVALIESDKVIVYIEENLYRTGVTFPLIPAVVSLKDYDDISKAKAEPLQGYPLICVTVSICCKYIAFCPLCLLNVTRRCRKDSVTQ